MSDMAAKLGFEDYALEKDFGSDKAGTVIMVDAERRKWLDENGYGKRVGRARESESPSVALSLSETPIEESQDYKDGFADEYFRSLREE